MNGTCRAGVVLTLSAIFLTVSPPAASADIIQLTVVSGPSFQQTDNSPCIIGDPSCHNALLPYTQIAPQFGFGTLSSPIYTVQQIRDAIGGDTFLIGLDLNQALGHSGGGFTLNSFTLEIDGVTRYSTSAPATLFPINPGNGFSDATIVQFNLSGLSGAQQLMFTASFSGGTAGREQFFLSATPAAAPIPEPTTLLLLGSGLAGLAAARRHRRVKSGRHQERGESGTAR